MAIAVLKEITSAEEQADLIEEQARLKAKEILSSAGKDAAVLAGQALEQAEREAREIMKAAEDKALLEIEKINSETAEQCIEIRKKAEEKLPAAVDFIVGRIVRP